jgi:hypothetical protein
VDVATARTVEPPDLDAVQRAQAEADEAAQLAAALEERVLDGDDDVTPDQIASARELGRFALLRAEASRRKAELAKKAERLRVLGDLAEEMRAADRDDEQIIGALDAFEAALKALGEAVGAHNARLGDWRRRMQAQAVPAHRGDAGHGIRDDAGLAYAEHGVSVSVDGARFGRLNTGELVGATVARVAEEWRHADSADQDRRYGHEYRGEALASLVGDLRGVYGAPIDLRDLIRRNA